MTKKFWKWPSIIRELSENVEEFQDLLASERKLSEEMRIAARSASDSEHRALEAVAAQRRGAYEVSEELSNCKIQVQKLSETISGLENRIARGELETERIKAELSKTETELARARLDEQREKDEHKKTRRALSLTREFIHVNNKLDLPARRGIRAALANGVRRFTRMLLLLAPLAAFSAPPAQFWHNPWTTNQTPRHVTGQDNLGVTNLSSGTNWLFYEVGPNTIARLIDVSNIVGVATGDAGGTNARQFGTLVLTNLSGNPMPYTNIMAADVGIQLGTNSGITYITNISGPFLTNWANSISNLVQTKQRGSAVLTNLSATGAVTNIVSLSTTNATSKPITNHFENGILTLYGLEAGANVSLSDNGSNIVITGSAGGAGITTNANQFGPSVELTIKDGALLTNMNFWSVGTNRGDFYAENIFPTASNAFFIGTTALPYQSVRLREGIYFYEAGDGQEFLRMGSPNSIVSSFDLQLPGAQGADGTVITNDGNGNLNWWNATAVIAQKQFGSAVLTNLVGTVGLNVTNVVSLSTTNATSKPLTNSYTTGVLTLFGLEQGANITLTPNGSNIVVASTASGGLSTNADQFAANTTLTIKEGALLTNSIHYQSNTTGPAMISIPTIGGITNLAEWRNTNALPCVTVNSNSQLSFGVDEIKTAIAFRTNQIDLSKCQWKPFTNSLQTNVVLQITNIQAGVQTTLDIYGAGIQGGTVTNAWQVLFTVGSGNTIFWPVGATNGNFDVLVNSNQVVQVNLWASRRTNVIASYKAFE